MLVSHDYPTMARHFYRFIKQRESPGLILMPQSRAVGLSITSLHELWMSTAAEAFRNRITYPKT